MARITPTGGRDLSAYDDGAWYTLTLSKIQRGNAKQSAFGPTLVLDFDDEDGNPGPGCLASLSVNDSPGGKPSKLKGSINSLLGHDASTPIVAFDDETFEVEYANGVTEQIEVGLRCAGRGEWSGDPTQFKLTAFRPVAAARSKAAPSAAKSAAAVVPF